MKVASSILVRNPLIVATTITCRELIIDLSSIVKRLMDVTNVVDDQAESKGSLIFFIREPILNLLIVLIVVSDFRSLASNNLLASCQSVDNIGRLWPSEFIVIEGAALIKVRLIDVVPVALGGVTLTLDIICEGSTLSEWVVTFVRGDRRVIFLKDSQFSDCSIKGSLARGGRLKNRLGSVGDCLIQLQLD